MSVCILCNFLVMKSVVLCSVNVSSPDHALNYIVFRILPSLLIVPIYILSENFIYRVLLCVKLIIGNGNFESVMQS